MAKQERKVKEFLARLLVGFAPFFKQVKRLTEFLKSKFYKHRVSFLTLFVILGLWLSYSLITWQACSDIDSFWEVMEILITKRNWLIIAGLPVAFCLWLFRTKDRKDQIEKAEGQIQKAEEQIQKTQESTQASLLANSLTLLTSGNVEARAVGLVQLLQLRNKEKVYKDQIDIATPGTNLQKANLSGANLQNAQLQGANLLGADLQKANLRSADLRNADFRGTNLQGANVLEAKFESAQYNTQTIPPHDNFKPQKHGMKFKP